MAGSSRASSLVPLFVQGSFAGRCLLVVRDFGSSSSDLVSRSTRIRAALPRPNMPHDSARRLVCNCCASLPFATKSWKSLPSFFSLKVGSVLCFVHGRSWSAIQHVCGEIICCCRRGRGNSKQRKEKKSFFETLRCWLQKIELLERWGVGGCARADAPRAGSAAAEAGDSGGRC